MIAVSAVRVSLAPGLLTVQTRAILGSIWLNFLTD